MDGTMQTIGSVGTQKKLDIFILKINNKSKTQCKPLKFREKNRTTETQGKNDFGFTKKCREPRRPNAKQDTVIYIYIYYYIYIYIIIHPEPHRPNAKQDTVIYIYIYIYIIIYIYIKYLA